MVNYEQELSNEIAHYNDILAIIKRQLNTAKNGHAKSDDTLRKTNRDMWENASHSSDDFDRVVELSQFYQPLANNIYAVESTAGRVRLLEQLLQSAYFARIDFRAV